MEFTGIWRGGDDAYALWTGAQWDDFQTKKRGGTARSYFVFLAIPVPLPRRGSI